MVGILTATVFMERDSEPAVIHRETATQWGQELVHGHSLDKGKTGASSQAKPDVPEGHVLQTSLDLTQGLPLTSPVIVGNKKITGYLNECL